VAKSAATYGGDPRHHHTDLAELRAENERLKRLVRSQMVGAGPYMLTQWTDDIRHVDPCDCDLDDETAGEACMANSVWHYAVVVDGGAFAPRLIVRLPRQAPAQRDDDHDPLLAVTPERLWGSP
jgi:hypothetical protein